MRTFLGYVFIFMFVPLFCWMFFLSYSEWSASLSLNQVLDKKIPMETIPLAETSWIKDKNGSVIASISNQQHRVSLDNTEIPTFLKDVFIIAEDRSFYDHSGFDAAAISRAIMVNASSDSIEQGGSTITQQLARNSFLSSEKTYNRKLAELLHAYQLERKYSKTEILEHYINAIYFHNGMYGIEAAANFYFTNSADKLTNAELAFLAAIPNNPNAYNPLKHYDATKRRQERLIKQLSEAGKLTKSETNKLIQEKITLNVQPKTKEQYPDYTDYVNYEFNSLIARVDGLEAKLVSKDSSIRKAAQTKLNNKVQTLLESGITIETALDPAIQKASKESVQQRLKGTDIEASAVVIEHHTQKLVSLIGGKNYIKNSFNRSYQSYRQPGSAMKPLLVYAPYFEETNAPTSQLISGASYCKNGYCPRNAGGGSYGSVTLKQAFARSYNTPAIRLFEKTGIATSFSYLKPFRFQKITTDDYTLPAAVGGFSYGVSTLELTRAFTSFANGTYKPAHAIMKVRNKQGKTLYQWDDKATTIWSGQTVKKMRNLLHEVTVNGTGRKAYIERSYIGGKTGTTNDVKDLWFVGLTNDYTTGIWIGRDQPSSMAVQQYAAPHLTIWKTINLSIPNL